MTTNNRRGARRDAHDSSTSPAHLAFGENRRNVASNTRTMRTREEPAPTDPYAPTLSPTQARGTGSADTPPTEDEIRRRAYEIYQSRGGESGHQDEDWAQAERELRAKRKVT